MISRVDFWIYYHKFFNLGPENAPCFPRSDFFFNSIDKMKSSPPGSQDLVGIEILHTLMAHAQVGSQVCHMAGSPLCPPGS